MPDSDAVAVIGGFAADALEDAEKIVQDMLAAFIRSQRTNPVMKSQKLWAAENRPRSERMRCKVVSKIKKVYD